MLDEGFHAGLGYMGIRSRTVMYAEREAYPVSVLEARMEEGSIHPAPIWFGNFTELPARQFRGVVDCVVAGFPCQDLSVAGRRAGLDGKRSGLFFEVVRIATDCGAWLMLLENVAGIATATASVMDSEEGELDERAASRVVGELADIGWDAEWITISASDVGASHVRARWFCVAWKLGNAMQQRPRRSGTPGQQTGGSEPVDDGNDLANADGIGLRSQGDGEQQAGWIDKSQFGLFAPGPSSPAWKRIIDASPWLSPALEPTFHQLVNGLAFDMDDCRAARLKCSGNGVVALQAALATVILAQRAGIFE